MQELQPSLLQNENYGSFFKKQLIQHTNVKKVVDIVFIELYNLLNKLKFCDGEQEIHTETHLVVISDE